MPFRSVNDGFIELHSRLTPSKAETSAATSHRTSIKSCLETNFGLDRFFRTGSFGNGTSVYGHSDIDYFAIMPNKSLTNSSDYSMRRVKDALDNRFPYSNVTIDCPAIKLPFGNQGSETHEITIGDYVGEYNNYPVYDIPDCNNGWMRSSPDAHNAYVRRCDSRLSNKIKPLIRFIKLWKYTNRVPISSFYLELRAARWSESETTIQYDIDVRAVLRALRNNELAMMQDPMGISGYISSCSSEAKKLEALSKLDTAILRANQAIDAGQVGNIDTAFEAWDRLFAGQFPARYY